MIFLKILFWLWLSITVINLVFGYSCSFSVAKAIKKQNGKKIQITKTNLETFISFLRTVIVSALPFFHILLFCVYVFNYDKIYENALEKVKKDFEII